MQRTQSVRASLGLTPLGDFAVFRIKEIFFIVIAK